MPIVDWSRREKLLAPNAMPTVAAVHATSAKMRVAHILTDRGSPGEGVASAMLRLVRAPTIADISAQTHDRVTVTIAAAMIHLASVSVGRSAEHHTGRFGVCSRRRRRRTKRRQSNRRGRRWSLRYRFGSLRNRRSSSRQDRLDARRQRHRPCEVRRKLTVRGAAPCEAVQAADL